MRRDKLNFKSQHVPGHILGKWFSHRNILEAENKQDRHLHTSASCFRCLVDKQQRFLHHHELNLWPDINLISICSMKKITRLWRWFKKQAKVNKHRVADGGLGPECIMNCHVTYHMFGLGSSDYDRTSTTPTSQQHNWAEDTCRAHTLQTHTHTHTRKIYSCTPTLSLFKVYKMRT